MGRGTPYPQTWDGVPPPSRPGQGTPQTWDGVLPPRQSNIASTCYSAGGMPLAFTQEDFLVIIHFTFMDAPAFSSFDKILLLGIKKNQVVKVGGLSAVAVDASADVVDVSKAECP